MKLLGYRLIGFVVWKVAAWYLRRRYCGAPKKVAAGVVLVAVVAVLLLALRRRGDEQD